MDDILKFLATLTPAVLPVMVLVYHKTRRELRGIRNELFELRQRPAPPDPRLDELLEAVDALGAKVERLTEAQRNVLSPGPGPSTTPD